MRTIYTFISLIILSCVTNAQNVRQSLPVSTQLTISKANIYNQNNEVLNVFLIANLGEQSVGTGFLLKSGHVISNEHVVRNAATSQVILYSPDGKQHKVAKIIVDTVKDLAVLSLTQKISGGFELGDDNLTSVGSQIYTWGFPLGYNGPNPLLSVGYIAGVNAYHPYVNKTVKHWVVNGAFNPGNSGGPLIFNSKVVGVVQSKALPLTSTIVSALNALNNNSSGFTYTSTDATGKQFQMSEAQVIGRILLYYQNLAQVMIGEAITISELKLFLTDNNIKGF